jgi:CBS domain-containing protein
MKNRKDNREEKQNEQSIIDAEVQKDLLRSESEGFSVMYESEKKAQVKSIHEGQSEKKKGAMKMRIKEIMTYDPVCCTPETSLRDVARMMLDCDCGEIPVVDNSTNLRPVGVITDRDIVCRAVALDKNPLQMTAKECMSAPCVAVDPETTIDECCRILEEKQIRRLPVVDEQGCCGIVSLADIAAHKLRDQLAEVLEEVSQPTHRFN